MSKEPHPAFTKNFKLGYDAREEHEKHNIEIKIKKAETEIRKEIGLNLSSMLSEERLTSIPGVGKVMAERIQRHFGGGSDE